MPKLQTSAKLSPSEKLARLLSAKFLEEGNYSPGVAMKAGKMLPASLRGIEESPRFEMAFSEAGFSGLLVQAVGLTVGVVEEKVIVYVSSGRMKSSEMEIDGVKIPVQVNKIGRLAVKPEQASVSTHRGNMYLHKDKIACGSSCAPSGENYSGTFGAIIRKKDADVMYVLSNNHVLAACNHTPLGQPIMSPSNSDSSPMQPSPLEIAIFDNMEELHSGTPSLVKPCTVDVAIGRVKYPDRITSWQGDADNGYDTPSETIEPTSGMAVKKYGRTTGLTFGEIESKILTDVPLPYKTRYFSSTVWFTNVWVVNGRNKKPFASAGDSGSLVVTENGESAVGLIFASTSDRAVIIPIASILACFGGVELVRQHEV